MLLSTGSVRLFRNNSGWAQYAKGGKKYWVKYGVANPGGSDIIGIRTIIRGGEEIGQFVALEVKSEGKKPTPKQANFIKVINGLGGLAAVVRSEEEAKALLQDG